MIFVCVFLLSILAHLCWQFIKPGRKKEMLNSWPRCTRRFDLRPTNGENLPPGQFLLSIGLNAVSELVERLIGTHILKL